MFPILFTIGTFKVYTFGFFLALAFLFSTFFIWRYSRDELMEEEYLDTYLYTSIVMLIFSRMIYILFHIDEFGLNILRFIVVRETPGLSLLGGFLSGFLFLLWYSKRKNFNLSSLSDLFSIAFCFALIFAKLGELLGGAGFGSPTDLPFGVRITGLTDQRHPVELYEATLLTIIFALLIFIRGKTLSEKWPKGLLFCTFTLLLAVSIFTVEFFKPHGVYLYGMSLRQIVALLMIIAVFIPLIKKIQLVRFYTLKNKT